MRTTLDLDEDILAAARELASMRGQSIGTVLSQLARTGLHPPTVEIVDGLPLIRATPTSPVITSEMVRAAQDDA